MQPSDRLLSEDIFGLQFLCGFLFPWLKTPVITLGPTGSDSGPAS